MPYLLRCLPSATEPRTTQTLPFKSHFQSRHFTAHIHHRSSPEKAATDCRLLLFTGLRSVPESSGPVGEFRWSHTDLQGPSSTQLASPQSSVVFPEAAVSGRFRQKMSRGATRNRATFAGRVWGLIWLLGDGFMGLLIRILQQPRAPGQRVP